MIRAPLESPAVRYPARRDAGMVPALPRRRVRLSERQQEVVLLTGLGYTAPEIAKELKLSLHTVRDHLASAHAKLGTHSGTAMVHAAYETGAVPEPVALTTKLLFGGIQLQLLQGMSQGHDTAALAKQLGFPSRREANAECRRLLRHLKVKRRPHLMTRARQFGLLGTRCGPLNPPPP